MFLAVSGQMKGQCNNPANAIVAENCLPGSSDSEWDVKNGFEGDHSIQGFATDISVNRGSTIYFKIDTPAPSYTIDIYRMGYYGGMGAHKVTSITPSATLPQTQPACRTDTTVGLMDCGNWAVSASWPVPATATSGVYFAHLIRRDTGGDSHIVFIVRNDSSNSPILFQTADETWQAYNYYGLGSVYSQDTPVWDLAGRSLKVSYNRPFYTRNFNQENVTFVFGAEFAMIQWLEQNGYDVTYFTGVDAARYGTLIKNHKVYMDAGHDEYWSGPHRANVQAARDAGVNLAFIGGNQMFWKTRLENSIDGSNTPNRTLVCYKETLAFAKIDPSPTWTGTWRDSSLSPPADGGLPENSLMGSLFMVNGTSPDNDGSLQIQVPAADGKMRFWRNSAVAGLSANQTYTLPLGTLGFEWDEDVDNGFRPAGVFHLSTTTHTLTSDYLLDAGATYGAGTATHHMTLYRAPSGALVFNAGTIQWSWALNSNHDNPFQFDAQTDRNAQQATVNLLADMGVQPATLQAGVMPATASTDSAPPASAITYPTENMSINTGTAVTVTGNAIDAGGGAVGAVEVSGDGGATWHPATGRSSWSYVWIPSATGPATLMSRAVDDSANLETAHGINLNVLPQVCPCRIWTSSVTPQTIDSGDGNAVEVGLKFRADSNGSVLGVRFYKATTNTGTHVGHIWSSSGALLGTATFAGESSSGWQQVNFSSPIPVTANTTYVVSYLAPSGHYSVNSGFFAQSGVNNPPLHALADGVDGLNGVYTYGATGGFPTSSSQSGNYWVDVVFTSSNTYNISGAISGASGAGATVALTGAATASTTADTSGNYSLNGLVNGAYSITPSKPGVTFSPGNLPVTINNTSVSGANFTATVTNPQTISGTITGPGGSGATVNLGGAATATSTADSSGNYSFTGLPGGSYSVEPSAVGIIFTPGVRSVVLSGAGAAGVNFQAQTCNCISIWPASATPAIVDSNDATPVEVGVKFVSTLPGVIYGLRFYKASANTGTHVGHLWSSTGTQLASATFTGETASGWQQIIFSTPISVTPNVTYVASYFAPNGHYSADTNYFASNGVNTPPLQALASTTNSSNGIYLYSSSGGFPTNSYASSNYWVDVLFVADQSHAVSGIVTGPGGAGATVTLTNDSGTITTTADSSGKYLFNGVTAGSYSVRPSNTNAAFIPAVQNVLVSSADITGLNFVGSSLCPCGTIWQPSALPAVIDSGDGSSVETGVRFQADYDGYILGVRFYKAAANTGSHIGNLWSAASGSLLATGGFTAESGTGWQQVMFANPVPVSANTPYVASYFSPQGHYSATNLLFASAGVDSPPLHALVNTASEPNGLFSYSPTSTYPTQDYNATNYWVDVVYARATAFSISGIVSGPGAAGTSVTLSGPSGTSSTVADAAGNYRFNGLANGTYTVTPTGASGVTFGPFSQNVTISGGHVFGINFTASQLTYSISGTISGVSGDPVVLSGASNAITTTDSLGNYTFTGLLNGSYTVTPGAVGYVINPSSQNVTVSGANVSSVNFTGSSLAYSISGVITGGAGAIVTLAGAANVTTTADSSGNFSFPGLTNGSYTVTPSRVGMVFNPASLAATVFGANVTNANFVVPANCPCNTIWQPSATPVTVDPGDTHSTEAGVVFRADSDGYIAGIRFYKGSANTGTHKGNLWSNSGALLGTADFSNETASGWQQVMFSSPVPVVANTPYVGSYFAPVGHYSGDSQFFATGGVDVPPLHALQNGVAGSNGIYIYTSTSVFPTSTFNAANYWVDVIYLPTATYSATGSITGGGGVSATLNLSGAKTATITADSSGNFSFSGLANGTYTITPNTANGYGYSPASQTITINNAHALGLTFTSQQTYAVSGTVSGPGGPNALVALSGTATATVTANSSGVYTLAGLANGSYTVTPTKTGYVFSPASQPVAVSGANATANFNSTAQTYTISGTISGGGGASATVKLTGATTATVTANSSGVYTLAGLANGSYTVTPTKTGYVFSPASQPVAVSGANATANFSSAAQTYTISGTISGAGGVSATVKLTGTTTATVTANASGVYTFTGVANGSYTVTPTKAGYVFTPATRSVTVNGANTTANFSSTKTYSISGTISGGGGAGATVKLTGAGTATVTASSSGAYTISGLVSGSYTVTPSRSGHIFIPSSRSATVGTSDVTGLNFTSF
ncbi:DUF4082 domain-containing protein [Edaphobacter modestus]|uniref:DUF4082 domain-containing protein n=1 Tax=Edaphobacter modestus TaxID=388466 RepID=UPI001F5E8444|nr:DUF4082 domain-containing protein [Edaphobacter modestus]